MENQTHLAYHSQLNILPSGDPGTAFHYLTSAEILARFGPPGSLLSTSAKAEKCLAVDVYLRILYLTPGIFCPGATNGCLRACLGHSSGRMQMPTHAVARDRRAAQYLENPALFLARLTLELAEHCQEAARRNPETETAATEQSVIQSDARRNLNSIPYLHSKPSSVDVRSVRNALRLAHENFPCCPQGGEGIVQIVQSELFAADSLALYACEKTRAGIRPFSVNQSLPRTPALLRILLVLNGRFVVPRVETDLRVNLETPPLVQWCDRKIKVDDLRV